MFLVAFHMKKKGFFLSVMSFSLLNSPRYEDLVLQKKKQGLKN